MRQAEPPFKGSSGGNPVFGVCVCWAFRCEEARTLSELGACDTLWGQETNLCAGVRTGEPASPPAGAGYVGEQSAESDTLCH